MEPIKLYFAGRWAAPEEDAPLVKCRLVSHAYPSQIKRWLQMNPTEPGEIILDSGAFSAWNKGDVIDLDAYIKQAHEIIEMSAEANKEVHVVNLDVIPGKKGETKDLLNALRDPEVKQQNKEIINKAAAEGLKNLKIMLSNGITPIHVFHQGEDWKWLDKMLELTDYIGISPANDMSQTSKKAWMDSVFDYLYKNGVKVRTHGFAVTAITSIRDLPWHSCDSTTWRLFAGYGKVIFPHWGFSSDTRVISNSNFTIWRVSDRTGGRGYTITDEILKQFERDGYTYEDLQSHLGRARINLHFFLRMQNDINWYKSMTPYEPLQNLI